VRGPRDRTAIAGAALKIPEAEPWPERSGIEEMAAAVGDVTSRKTRPEGGNNAKVRRRLRIDGFIVLASGSAVLLCGLIQVL
jgi:hypothetical protein